TDDFFVTTGADANAYFNRSYESLMVAGSRPGYGKYVHPGRARTSPLIWHIFGRNTSRPWDATFGHKGVPQMPPNPEEALTDYEKRTLVEWIDTGGLWSGIPRPESFAGDDKERGGFGK
ncbi:MAG: hypothetical protein ACYTBS_27395, partial [Planctomycetota bacterium]